MALEVGIAKCLGQQISAHVFSVHVGNRDDVGLLHLARVVVRKRNVLGRRAMDRIVGHGDCALVVASVSVCLQNNINQFSINL